MIRFLFFNGGDKTIPAPRHGLYVSRLIAVIPQGLSKREDCLRQIRLLHKRVGPNLFQQVIPFDELTGVQNQPDKYLGGFRPKRNHFTGTSEQTIIQVELVRSKAETRTMRHIFLENKLEDQAAYSTLKPVQSVAHFL